MTSIRSVVVATVTRSVSGRLMPASWVTTRLLRHRPQRFGSSTGVAMLTSGGRVASPL